MWNRISIRWQLIALLTLAILIVEVSSLILDFRNDIQQRKSLAIEQAQTISRSLQLDLLKAIVSPKADTYADITFRISNYQSVGQLSVFNTQKEEVFRYVKKDMTMQFSADQLMSEQPVFGDQYLFVQHPITVDGHQFGSMGFVFNLNSYNTGLKQQLRNKLLLFGSQLLGALLLAWLISKNYTRPFTRLADTMCSLDIKHNKFPTIQTRADNEIGVLYDGYNKLVCEVSSATSELQYQSQHDSLTGLLNRFGIDQLIQEALANNKIQSNVLLMLDIDQFKMVNDTSGHVAGDELLKQIAQIFASTLKEEHHLARVGADDFIILLPDCQQEEGQQQARKLLDAVAEYRFTWNNNIHNVTGCIGLVTFKAGEFTPKNLHIAVDSAFYTAKSQGQNRLSIYTPDDEHILQYNADVKTVAVINDALKQGQARFELFAQSITPLQKTTERFSYEILLRLKDANGDMVYPDLFLPTANRYQLMVAIDSFVLETYLQTVSKHPEHIRQLDFVNINLGGSTLNNVEFQTRLRQAIDIFDFPWNKLVLEVTETSAVGNLGLASDFIGFCREKGIKVALDDFGTGYSSLAYLKQFPLDVLKIDRSFVSQMHESEGDLAIVHMVMSLAHELNLQVVAEGVETQEQQNTLTELSCEYLQGYLLDKPLSASDFQKRLEQLQ